MADMSVMWLGEWEAGTAHSSSNMCSPIMFDCHVLFCFVFFQFTLRICHLPRYFFKWNELFFFVRFLWQRRLRRHLFGKR